MKKNIILLTVLLMAVVASPTSYILAHTQVCQTSVDPEACSDAEFSSYLKYLKRWGNDCYESSDKQGIKQSVDLYRAALQRRKNAGRLEEEDEIWHEVTIAMLEGDYYYEQSETDRTAYSKGAQSYQKVIDIQRRYRFPNARMDTLAALVNLGQLYYKKGDYGDALHCLESAFVQYEKDYYEEIITDTLYLKALQGLAICQARNSRFEDALRNIDAALDEARACGNKLSEAEAMRKKAKIFLLRREETGVGAAEALNLYRSYFNIQKEDSKRNLSEMNNEEREHYWGRMRPFLTDCYRLEDADPEFLYDVTLFTKNLLTHLYRSSQAGVSGKAAVEAIDVDWKRIQKELTKEMCAVEFIQYEKKGHQKMAALVLRSKGTPKYIQMEDPDNVMKHVINGRSVEERLFSTRGSVKNSLYRDSALMKIIWNEALLKAVGNSSVVCFAPDGYLHQLAVEYMLPEELKARDFMRLTTTRMLLERGKDVHLDNALIFGGVDYDRGNTPQIGEDGDTLYMGDNDLRAYQFVRGKGVSFPFLEGSLIESKAIMEVRHSESDTLLTGMAASEAAFAALAPRYQLLQVSTHGYFTAGEVRQGTDLKPCLSDDALSQSVLAFSGVNRSLRSSGSVFSDDRDGLLSAREVSAMDLSRTGLVVFSACQLGMGYITSDGVYGMQRGLKNAGAGSMILALWSVSDEATTYLMRTFHANISNGMGIRQAFADARTRLSSWHGEDAVGKDIVFNAATLADSVEEEEDYNFPQYTDAFVLIDVIN